MDKDKGNSDIRPEYTIYDSAGREPTWHKSSFSASGECAEVASGVRVRDSKQAGNPDRTVLTFTDTAWTEFVTALKGSPASISREATRGHG